MFTFVLYLKNIMHKDCFCFFLKKELLESLTLFFPVHIADETDWGGKWSHNSIRYFEVILQFESKTNYFCSKAFGVSKRQLT